MLQLPWLPSSDPARRAQRERDRDAQLAKCAQLEGCKLQVVGKAYNTPEVSGRPKYVLGQPGVPVVVGVWQAAR